MSDIIINNQLKRNYKILIKDNYFKFPLLSYYHIHKIYGCNFSFDKDKLQDLICFTVFNNNIELTKILCKTLPNSTKYSKNKLSHLCCNNKTELWDLYNKSSNKNDNTNNTVNYYLRNYYLRNSNKDFIRFKELISTFCMENNEEST